MGNTSGYRQPSAPIGALGRQLFKAIIVTALLAAIGFFVNLTERALTISAEKGRLSSVLTLDASTTITIVRTMQAINTTLLGLTLAESFYYIQWSFLSSSSQKTVPYFRQLALSPTTSAAGTLRLIVHRDTPWLPRLWGLSRMLLLVLVGSGGVILFFRTSTVVVFDTAYTYDVTAGTGPFNASYVDSFFTDLAALEKNYTYAVLPYSYYGPANDLITNPFYTTTTTPLGCEVAAAERDSAADCAAYLVSGGVVGLAPWVPAGYPDHQQVLVNNVPTIHVEFAAMPAGRTFANESCRVYGSNTTRIAAKLCLSQPEPTKLDAGIFICRNGITANNECRNPSNATVIPNITTTLSFFRRQAGKVLSSKLNLTISEVTNLDFPPNTQPQLPLTTLSPTPIPLTPTDLASYSRVLTWLLDFSASNIPPPSSLIENFWSAHNQLQHPFLRGIITRHFRSILIFPLWLFNANNYGNVNLSERTIAPDMPSEFYTTASIVRSFVKIRFDPVLVGVFLVFQGVAVLFVWAVLGYAVMRRDLLPEISSYPMFDAEFKARTDGYLIVDDDGRRKGGVWRFGDREVLDAMRTAKVGRRL